MKRIGVFLCHCGLNIADTVDIERVRASERTTSEERAETAESAADVERATF